MCLPLSTVASPRKSSKLGPSRATTTVQRGIHRPASANVICHPRVFCCLVVVVVVYQGKTAARGFFLFPSGGVGVGSKSAKFKPSKLLLNCVRDYIGERILLCVWCDWWNKNKLSHALIHEHIYGGVLRWLCEYKYLCDLRVYLVVEIDANSRWELKLGKGFRGYSSTIHAKWSLKIKLFALQLCLGYLQASYIYFPFIPGLILPTFELRVQLSTSNSTGLYLFQGGDP